MEETCERLAQELVSRLSERGNTLATAESCTGGLIAHLVTNVPGSSQVFMGSCVVYSNDAKRNLLDVSSGILEGPGAVSEECVLAMAEAIRRRFDCDYGLAVSGIAGPGGATETKPVGTVWIGVGSKQLQNIQIFRFKGNREQIIELSSICALNQLRKFILEIKSTNKHVPSLFVASGL